MSRATTAVSATRPQTESAITRGESPARGRLEGEQADDIILPRIHVYQGLQEEEEKFGKHERGDLINTLDGELIGTKEKLPKFIPLFAWNLWIKFREPRGAGIEYMTRNRSEVPDEDLVFVETATGRKPKATQIMNWAVLIEGRRDVVLFSFKSTSIKTGKTINTIEKNREAAGKGFGFYALDLKPKKNSKGAWFSPEVRPAGDPPPEMKKLAEALYATMSKNESLKENTDATLDEHESGGDDDFDPNAS